LHAFNETNVQQERTFTPQFPQIVTHCIEFSLMVEQITSALFNQKGDEYNEMKEMST